MANATNFFPKKTYAIFSATLVSIGNIETKFVPQKLIRTISNICEIDMNY